MKLKASYYDVVLNSPSLVAIFEIFKDYGWSVAKMNQYLHDKGVQSGRLPLTVFGLYLLSVCRGLSENAS